MIYHHLNHQIPSDDTSYTDAWRRVLNRLGEYTATIAHMFRMNPTKVEILTRTENHILVRIHMPHEYVVLRVSPEEDLAREVYYGRMMDRQNLPVARIIHYDLSRTHVPFAYTLEGYIGGIDGDQLESPSMLEGLARQVGRTMRRMHRIEAQGWGTPEKNGRWKNQDWRTFLLQLNDSLAPKSVATMIFGEGMYATCVSILEHLATRCSKACLMHGAVGPQTARCTVNDEQVRLEALVHPGKIVGGDGLLDLALSIVPIYPQEWCHGVFQGYVAIAPLSMNELEQLRRWQVITCYWKTCSHALQSEPCNHLLEQTLLLLSDVTGESRIDE
jgi:hypothetical protein